METTSLRSALRVLTAGLALACTPSFAQVQGSALTGSVMAISKSEAILGTASALDRLLAQQGARPAIPASVTTRSLTPSLFDAATLTAASAPASNLVVSAVFRGPVAADRPDVFDSVALAIGWSPLKARWARVEHGAPDAPAAHFAASLGNRNLLRRLEAVNLYVNRRVRFVDDSKQYGVADYWAPAAQTLSRGRGDCEDFAIAKLQLLRSAGFADKDLYLVILHDVARRADHAVLVARAEGRLLVLDNGTSRIVDSAMISDYRPIFTFSGNKVWTHGYRHVAPPVVLASIDQAQPVRSAMVEMASINSPIAPAGLSN